MCEQDGSTECAVKKGKCGDGINLQTVKIIPGRLGHPIAPGSALQSLFCRLLEPGLLSDSNLGQIWEGDEMSHFVRLFIYSFSALTPERFLVTRWNKSGKLSFEKSLRVLSWNET